MSCPIIVLNSFHLRKDEPGETAGDADQWDVTVNSVPAVAVPEFRCPLSHESLSLLKHSINIQLITFDNIHVFFRDVKTYVLQHV